jgi:hypothetical protein
MNEEQFGNLMIDFVEFPKMARLTREIIITEKIDGTNAQICITEDGEFLVGSRTRWITPEDDNHGFAKWAHKNKDELLKLGVGHHFGEWWGQGIQRGYGLKEKRFSLFNVERWSDDAVRPKCCHVVPLLWRGIIDLNVVDNLLDGMREGGSVAAPGFMNPEGVVVFHVAANHGFKKTLDNNDGHKGSGKDSEEVLTNHTSIIFPQL